MRASASPAPKENGALVSGFSATTFLASAAPV